MTHARRARAEAGVLEAAALAAEHAATLLRAAPRDIHGAVAGRVHRVVELAAGGPTIGQRAHDGIAGAVYGGLGLGLRTAGRGLRAADRMWVGAPRARVSR